PRTHLHLRNIDGVADLCTGGTGLPESRADLGHRPAAGDLPGRISKRCAQHRTAICIGLARLRPGSRAVSPDRGRSEGLPCRTSHHMASIRLALPGRPQPRCAKLHEAEHGANGPGQYSAPVHVEDDLLALDLALPIEQVEA